MKNFLFLNNLNYLLGMLFAYEIYEPTIDKNLNLTNEDSIIRIKINVGKPEKQKKRQSIIFKHVSYTRIFMINKDLSLRNFYIEIYKIFRPYLRDFYNKKMSKKKENVIFDENPPNYENEMSLIFSDKLDICCPYNLYIFDENKYEELPFIDKRLNEVFDSDNLDQDFFEIELIFNKDFPDDLLRLNRCRDENISLNRNNNNPHSLNECLNLFTKEEILDKDNEWYCNKCKEHKQATKKMELYKTPKILILHLKRFDINYFYFSYLLFTVAN